MASQRSSISLGTLKNGDRVWVKDEVHAWLHGTVISRDTKTVSVRTEKGELATFSVADIASNLDLAGNHIELQIDNLVELDELSEGAILHHVRKRFSNKVIYTHVGAILVAVNPFEQLDIYSETEMQRAKYSVKNGNYYPHVYVTAATAYENLVAHSRNQSVLISGESGAGKTETTKKVLTYLANCASANVANKPSMIDDEHDHDVSIEEKILQSNPLLEALGNAKTLRNNNSSRFGKWMKVDFDGAFKIQGSEIKNYLLEKSRVVNQSADERNYHIFYQLVRGSDEPTRKKLFLGDVSSYRYICGCSVVPNVDDTRDFLDVLDALYTLQFPQIVVEHMFKVLSAVLALGNVDFKPIPNDSNDACEIGKMTVPTINNAAALLGVDSLQLGNCLKSKNVQMGKGSMVSIRLTAHQAADFRDTLAKSLYGNLFDWVVLRINDSLKTSSSKYSIGILDIFGFEVFENNSFEQLCINYANEKLQNHFNSVIFKEETKLYVDEGIPLESINFVDNSGCVNLIEGKPFGLILLLDEECTLGNGSDNSYINKITKQFEKTSQYYQKHKTKPDKFYVMHFAGPVEYTVTNFLDKNRDTLSATCKEVMLQSTIPLIAGLFSDSVNDVGLSGPATPDKRGSSTLKSATIKASDQKTSKITLGSQFRSQLIGLINMIQDTEPHFIRCVKPNHQKVGGVFDGQLALRQLRYAGLFEAIRIRKAGFSFRMPLNSFANIYERIVKGLTKRRNDKAISDKESCGLIILEAMHVGSIEEDSAFIGVTKVFMKSNNDRVALDRLRAGAVIVFVTKLQRLARRYLARMRKNRERYEREKKRLAEERRRRQEEARTAEAKRVERDRLEAIQREDEERRRRLYEMHSASCVIVQKYWRRRAVKMSSTALEAYKLVQFAKTCKQSSDVYTLLNEIDMIPIKFSVAVRELSDSFFREKKEVKALADRLDKQEMFISDMDLAITNGDVTAVNSLLDSVNDFGLADHDIVVYAKRELKRLQRKYEIMKVMVHFVRSQDLDSLESINSLLEEARTIGVDGEFITRTERLYDNLGPKLRLKMLLRSSIERVHRVRIEALMSELDMIRASPRDGQYADVEHRAAKQLLSLLSFEKTLYPHKYDIGSLDWVFEDGRQRDEDWDNEARLNDTVIKLCDAISSSDRGEELYSKQLLEEYCCFDRYKFQRILRAYKWSTLLCTWKQSREGSGVSEEKGGDIEDSFDDQRGEGSSTKSSPYSSPGGSPRKGGMPAARGANELVFYHLNVTRARELLESRATRGNGAIFRRVFEQQAKVGEQASGSEGGGILYDQVPAKVDDVYRNLSKAFGREDHAAANAAGADLSEKSAVGVRPSELVSGSYIKDYIMGLERAPKAGTSPSSTGGSPSKRSPSKCKTIKGVSPEKRFFLTVGGVQTSVRAAYTIGGTLDEQSSPIGALGVTRELEEKLYASRRNVEAMRAQKSKFANASPEKRSPEKGFRL